MLGLCRGVDEKAAADAELILKMETRLANASMTRLERRNPHATYNKMTVENLEVDEPSFQLGGLS